MKNRVKELRNFIKSKNADAILINSADDFLSEYNILPLNSRYKVTGFSGSMGDCIVTSDNVYQIADGRYHEQADKEVDHNVVTVLKMQQGSSSIEEILNVLDKNSTLILTANKVPMQFCQTLEKKAAKKKIKISYILNDPIEDLAQNKYTNLKVVEIPKSITKYSAEEKFKKLKLKDNEVLLITNPVDFAYFTNLRNFDFPYSAAPRAKAIVTNDEFEIFTDSKIPLKFDGLKIHKLSTFRKHLTNIREKSILVDKGALSQADFMHIHSSNKLKSSKIFELKSQKYNTEIVHLKSAFARTDKVLKKMDDLINSNKQLSELDKFATLNGNSKADLGNYVDIADASKEIVENQDEYQNIVHFVQTISDIIGVIIKGAKDLFEFVRDNINWLVPAIALVVTAMNPLLGFLGSFSIYRRNKKMI